jgi:hypothetical protein
MLDEDMVFAWMILIQIGGDGYSVDILGFIRAWYVARAHAFRMLMTLLLP